MLRRTRPTLTETDNLSHMCSGSTAAVANSHNLNRQTSTTAPGQRMPHPTKRTHTFSWCGGCGGRTRALRERNDRARKSRTMIRFLRSAIKMSLWRILRGWRWGDQIWTSFAECIDVKMQLVGLLAWFDHRSRHECPTTWRNHDLVCTVAAWACLLRPRLRCVLIDHRHKQGALRQSIGPRSGTGPAIYRPGLSNPARSIFAWPEI